VILTYHPNSYQIRHEDAPGGISYGTKAVCEGWRDENRLGLRPEGYVVEPVPHCICCGLFDVKVQWEDGWRCQRHWNSIPCQVEGCKRTASRERYTETICAEHWRAGVPPGSDARKVWNRLRRIGKRYGWTPERRARSDRLWEWLKARCRAAAAGDLDQREIDRMFGWDS
jgi:hypothetical protein